MPIDQRTFILALVAVFLALGIGVVIGVSVQGGYFLTEHQGNMIDRLEAEFEQMRAAARVYEEDRLHQEELISLERRAGEALMAGTVAYRLEGRSVAVLLLADAADPSSPVREQLAEILALAGAGPVRWVAAREPWWGSDAPGQSDPSGKDGPRGEGPLSAASTGGEGNDTADPDGGRGAMTALLEGLALGLPVEVEPAGEGRPAAAAGGDGAGGEAGPGAPSGEEAGADPAGAVGDLPSTPGTPSPMEDLLQAEDPSALGEPPSAVLIVYAAGGPADTELGEALTAVFTGDFPGARFVYAEAGSSNHSLIASMKTAGIPIIDHLELASSRAALVMALDGHDGHFGTDETADGLLPGWPGGHR